MNEAAVIRDYKPSDFEEIKRIHRQGDLDYKAPELNKVKKNGEVVVNPLFIVNKVLTVDGKIVCAVLWRMEVETYLLLDKSDWGDAEQKMLALKALQIEGLHDLWTKGIENCVAWIPQDVESYFSKRLTQLGWSPDRDGWRSWSRNTEPKQ